MAASGEADAISLVVGVTSHRDLREEELDGLRWQVARLFGRLRADFPGLELAVLSPLAEGGDQLVAQEALRQGARLLVPLPLPLDMYLRDFHGETRRTAFLELLRQGEALPLPLPEGVDADALCGPGPLRDMQYARCGLYVADHCHLLLALWDGRPSPRLGGTAQVVAYYLGQPMPGVGDARTRVRKVLANDDDSLVFHIPVGRQQHEPGVPMHDQPPTWLTSRGSSPGDLPMPAGFLAIFDRLQSFARDLRKYPETQVPTADADGSVVQRLFVGADRLAVHFRGRVLLALRATHVMVALMGITLLLYQYAPEPQWLLWLFLVVFASGILLSRVARRREWHRKYIDYRSLAEGLRVQWFWRRAGISATGDQNFAHDNFLQKQDVELGWIRNVMRLAGLQVTRPIAAGDVVRVCDQWVGEDDGSGSGGAELAWYTHRALERSRQEHMTQVLGAACLWAGIGICLLLALAYPRLPLSLRNTLEIALGTLSIIAAVRSAYAFRKADKELVRQYRFMQRIYRNARNALDACTDRGQRQEILQVLGEATLAEHAE
ncbi:MAG: hypothetical protein L0H23_00420, partial [Luteimonas sp.]|nr:hypothetical protein [Luteimonas sp.]